MKNKIIKNLSISVVAIGFLFPCAHLNASAAESQNNNEVPQVNTTIENNNDVSQQKISSQNSQDTQNQDVQPPNKPEINNDKSDSETNVPKQEENNNPASTTDDNRTPNKEEATHPDSSGAQETSNNETNGNQTQNSNNPSEKTDENAAGSKPNTNPNNASTNNENNSAGKSSEGYQPNESKSPANNTKDENAGEPNHPNASSNGQGNGNTHPTNTGEHNETTKPNQQPGKSEGNSSNVDPNDGKGGSGSHSTHVKNDGSEKEGTGTAQPNKGTEQPESPNSKKNSESTNKPKEPQPPKANQNPKAPSQNHQTPTRRPQPDLNKGNQQAANTTGRKENNQYKEKDRNAKSPNNSNKIPTRNWDSYPFPKTSGTTEQQNEKSTNRNSWKGNLYNNLTQSPTQQKASDERIHKASQYLVPFTTMNLAGNRFGHIVTGSFKYNPFVINQVSRMSEDSKTTEGDIHSALEHQNFASNRDLNNLQESTGYFKYQFFNPADAQQYYDNLDVQVLGLITGDIGSMPDLKRTKKSANFEVGSTNHAKDYSEKIDNTQEEEKGTKTESENTEKSHPRLIATLLATFGAAFIWFIILMFIHRRNDDNQEKED